MTTGTGAERLARIALAHLVEPGRRDVGDLVRAFGAARALERLAAGAVERGLADTVATRLADTDPASLAQAALARANKLRARIVTPDQAEWPNRLDDLRLISRPSRDPIDRDTDPPHCLWVRGPADLAETCERAVAVVGSRASSLYGDHVAGDLAYSLAERGWSVVSGGAFGIDAAAHRGALAAGGLTVAVLACGIDRPYPAGHAVLFGQISAAGLLVTEWPPGSDPHRRRFLVRNRVIAALTSGTVLVEANLRSGARFTLGRARDLNRIVMAVPGPVTSSTSAGSHEELRKPDTILVTGVAHVLDAVGRIGADLAPAARAEESPLDRLSALERQVLDGVRPRKLLTAEQIAAAVGVSTRDARRTLPALERAQFVTAHGDGYRLFRKSDANPRKSHAPPRKKQAATRPP